MMCVEFVANRETKALFPASLDIGKRIANHADAAVSSCDRSSI